MAEIKNTRWHTLPALSLESERLRVVVLPNLGAKIVSLFDKAHGREWLVGPMRPLKQTTYGADFVSQDMSGWDEMLPTIVACEWEGVPLPDHGEVWSIPWQIERAGEMLVCEVAGVARPYRFTRRAELVAAGTLELGYTLVNQGKGAAPFLWAAHPQFAVDEQTRISLPGEVTRVVNVIEGDPAWGKAGEVCDWPRAVDRNGQAWQLDRVGPAANRACRKFYSPPEQAEGWAALMDEKLGCQMRLEWPAEVVPYLGVWVDEGMYNSAPVVALEPSNGYYDSLERAVENRRVLWLAPGETATWTVRVTVA